MELAGYWEACPELAGRLKGRTQSRLPGRREIQLSPIIRSLSLISEQQYKAVQYLYQPSRDFAPLLSGLKI